MKGVKGVAIKCCLLSSICFEVTSAFGTTCPETGGSFVCFLSGDADTKYVMTITEEERSALDDEGGIEEKYLNRRFELTFTDGTPDLPPSGDQSPTDQQQSLAGTQVRLCMIHMDFTMFWCFFPRIGHHKLPPGD